MTKSLEIDRSSIPFQRTGQNYFKARNIGVGVQKDPDDYSTEAFYDEATQIINPGSSEGYPPYNRSKNNLPT